MKVTIKRRLLFKLNKNGFTLIEALVFLFLFSMIVMTFYAVFSNGIAFIAESKNKLGALALANEKMEVVHNLNYDSIGTISGIPAGIIPEDEDIIANTKSYHVKTFIQYMDDPFDDEFPDDTVPNDYKRVKITVSWSGMGGRTSEISLVSRFVPPGLEVNSGDGILSVNIQDSTGTGVSQAQVHIVNNDLLPVVDITQNTDNSGTLIFPGARQSIQSYEITASKNDYETVSTIDPNSVLYTATDTHASVIAGLINTKSITIDLLSDLKIKTADYLGNLMPDVDFHIEGGRILGTNNTIIPPETIYILDSDEATDAEGEKDFNEHSPGQFFLTNIGSVANYTLIGVSPIIGYQESPAVYKITLLPGESKTVEIKFADDSADSLLVRVKNSEDDTPINNVQVRLSNDIGYDTTVTTSFDGVAFFPINSDPFSSGNYDLEVSNSDFQTNTSAVEINNLTIQDVELTPL